MSEHRKGRASVNGAALYYEVSGTGDPILLLHAGIADRRMWEAQVEALSEHYQTIRFDMRGFGQSALPPGRFSNVEDILGLLDFLGVERAILLGCSYGGRTALDFVLTYPDRVKALILVAPSVRGEAPSDRIRQFNEEEDALLDKDDLEAATELNLRLWVDGPHRTPEQVDPAVRDLVRQMQLDIFKIPVPDEIGFDEPEKVAIEHLPEIDLPTLLIVGDLDLEEKLALVDRLAADLPDAQKVVISGAAHMVNMEKPEAFNQAVLKFLAE